MRAIQKCIDKYKTMKSVAGRPGHRLRKKTTAVEDQAMVRRHEESPFSQVKHTAAINDVSVQTMRKRLKDGQLYGVDNPSLDIL